MSFTDFIKNIILSIGMVYFSILVVFAPTAVFVLLVLSYYFYKKKDNSDDYHRLTRKELDRIIYEIKKNRKVDDER